MRKFKINLGNQEIEFRALSSTESSWMYNALTKSIGNPFLEEFIFQKVTDEKYNIDELHAGLISAIVYLAFKISGVIKSDKDIPDKIDKHREELNSNFYYEMYATICKVNPGVYSLEQLESMDVNRLFKLFAFAEKIHGKAVFDTKAMRDEISKSTQKVKSTGGLSSVSQEEIDLVKQMINVEEFRNGEMF